MLDDKLGVGRQIRHEFILPIISIIKLTWFAALEVPPSIYTMHGGVLSSFLDKAAGDMDT